MSTNEPAISHRVVVRGSDRAFGIVFAVVFAIIGLWPLLSGRGLRLWALGIACLFLAVALLAPWLLAPLNRIWFRFGLVLHHIVNPVVMGLVYYFAVVPMGLILKARGKDLLRLKRDPEAPTYWIAREPPGPAPGSMSRQF